MVKVEFLGPINKKPIEVEANNLLELSNKLKKDEKIKEWLTTCAVAVNDELVADLDKELKDGDKVVLLPPVCGG